MFGLPSDHHAKLWPSTQAVAKISQGTFPLADIKKIEKETSEYGSKSRLRQ
jgi:hypothetical protein